MFRRLLIANRGEIAARIIATCRRLGIETVAIYSDADRESPHLKEATLAVCIGPGRSADSYLAMDAILQAALQYDCQAVHPGYGFLAENALFARRCQLQQLAFIGPPPGAIALMGDKAAAKRTMRRLGLPTIPGSDGPVAGINEAVRAASIAGYPVLLKATAGGGGKGMRAARDESELRRIFPEAALEAEKAFSDRSLYVEAMIDRARHIEIQVLIDGRGGAVHLGERECSVQRSHQKLIEESPSPALGPAERETLGTKAAAALAAAGYAGAGTVEFLRAPDGSFYFMEVNARLQVEHPVTEMVTGLDLVEEQLRIAANDPIGFAQSEVGIEGCALELRINAEDPSDGFRPDPGTVTVWEPPAGDGLLRFTAADERRTGSPASSSGVRFRLDSHVEPGYRVPPYYDSLLGKLIVHAPDRPALLAAAARAVADFRIEGVKTTLPLLSRVLSAHAFRDGSYDLTTLPGLLVDAEVVRP